MLSKITAAVSYRSGPIHRFNNNNNNNAIVICIIYFYMHRDNNRNYRTTYIDPRHIDLMILTEHLNAQHCRDRTVQFRFNRNLKKKTLSTILFHTI